MSHKEQQLPKRLLIAAQVLCELRQDSTVVPCMQQYSQLTAGLLQLMSHLASVLSHDCTDNSAQSAVLWASFDCVLGHHLGPVRQGCPLQPSNLQDTANTHRLQHTCTDMCTRGVGCMQHTNKAKRQINHTLAQQHTKTLLDLSHQLHLAAM